MQKKAMGPMLYGAVNLAQYARSALRTIATMEPCKLAGVTSIITSATISWAVENIQKYFWDIARQTTRRLSSKYSSPSKPRRSTERSRYCRHFLVAPTWSNYATCYRRKNLKHHVLFMPTCHVSRS